MPPILDYAPTQARQASFPKLALAVAGILIPFLNFNFTMCMCGYQDFYSLPGNCLGIALAIIAFFLPAKAILPRCMGILALTTASVILFLNIHNILWSGHHPLLR